MHPLVWITWLISAFVMVSITRNPLYLILLFVEFQALLQMPSPQEEEDTQRRNPLNSWRFLLFAVPVGALFNGLTIHSGETVMLHLPDQLPLIGGAITLEAVLFGALNGLFLTVLLAAFGVFNRSTIVGDLIRYIPRAFYPLAIVVAIAVSYIPNTLQQFRRVKEAQSIRGHKMRGIRDWLPLFLPVLIGGLERAFQLAESMTSRGYAAGSGSQAGSGPRGVLAMTLGGLVTVLAGTILRMSGLPVWSTALMFSGSTAIILAVILAGRQIKHTRLHKDVFRSADILSVLAIVAAFGVYIVSSTSTRAYSPFPVLAVPGFNPASGLALFVLLTPMLAGNPRGR